MEASYWAGKLDIHAKTDEKLQRLIGVLCRGNAGVACVKRFLAINKPENANYKRHYLGYSWHLAQIF